MINKETQIKNTNKGHNTMMTTLEQAQKKMKNISKEEAMEQFSQIWDLSKGDLNSTQYSKRMNALMMDMSIAHPSVDIQDFKYATHSYIQGNQVAMFSNSSDNYHITQKTKELLESKNIDITDRRNKSTKNGYTFEHPVPCTVIRDEMAKVDTIQEKNEVLMRLALNVVILSSEEDKTLPRQNMPTNWDGHNVWARYEAAGLQVMDKTVSMHGPIRR